MEKFSDLLKPIIEADSFEQDKADLIEFIQELDKETFAELMDVISSLMFDPLTIGTDDDHEEEIEGDEAIKDAIDSGATPEGIAGALEECVELNERGNVSSGERLAAAKAKRRDPRIKKMMKIKNAWRKKCKKRNLVNKKGDSGKWGCAKVDKVLSIQSKKWQHNRQKSVKVD